MARRSRGVLVAVAAAAAVAPVFGATDALSVLRDGPLVIRASLRGSAMPEDRDNDVARTRHSWSASTQAPTLHGKGVRALSEPIEPIGYLTQAEGVITQVRWRYRFAKTPPTELQAHLCNASRCVLLTGAEGQTTAFSGDDAARGFVFAFRVPGQGPLAPVLQGNAAQVTVSYR